MTVPQQVPLFGRRIEVPGVERQDRPRLSKQCEAILARLKRGPATNDELSSIARKYTGRISDLRKVGWHIPPPKNLGGGLTEYELTGPNIWL